MNVLLAIPLEENRGADSRIAEHFGRARYFLIFDSESGDYRIVDFAKEEEGVCSPANFLIQEGVNAVYVLGMGYRARCILENEGIKVLTGPYVKAGEVLKNLERLERFRGGCEHH